MKKNKHSYLKVGDKVKVITGSQKGFIGIINSLILKKNLLIIEGIPTRVKFVKQKQGNETKQLEIATSIHISNVMLWDKDQNNIGKIGYKFLENKKVRYFKKSGNLV